MVGVGQREEYNPLNDVKLLDDINNAFIKKFKTDKNFYIYDVNTNDFLIVDNVIWELFPDNSFINQKIISYLVERYGLNELKRALLDISKAIKHGLFSSFKPDVGINESKSVIMGKYCGNCEQLILEVTQDCNFRCNYCVYSGIYKNRRSHKNKYLSWKIAKAAIKNFIKYSAKSNRNYISFYGGEPLLNKDIIFRTIEYLGKDSKRIFALTTNGYLLDDYLIEYIVRNNIYLTISLNGPENIHNRSRRLINGDRTYKRIINNIKIIRKRYPEYYESPFFILNCVLTPPWEINKVVQYFMKNFKSKLVMYQIVEFLNTDHYNKYTNDKNDKMYNRQINKIHSKYIGLLLKKNKIPYALNNLFSSNYSKVINRYMQSFSNIIICGNICWPGEKRLYVDIYGNYLPCEKTSERLIIGNVFYGYNFNNIHSYVSNIQEKVKGYCNHCWALRFCSQCMFLVDNDDLTRFSNLNVHCENRKYNVEKYFINYHKLLEKNPNIFDRYKKREEVM